MSRKIAGTTVKQIRIEKLMIDHRKFMIESKNELGILGITPRDL